MLADKLTLVRITELPQNPTPPETQKQPPVATRTGRLLQGMLSSMLSKGVVLGVSAVSIPITVRYLGPENFGVWVTISTALSMLLVLDLGVANSLTNFISEAYANDDSQYASTYSTTALGAATVLALLLGAAAWLIWPTLHWERLFHLTSSAEAPVVGRAVAAALVIFLVGLPAGLAPKILGGYQELRAGNLFVAAGSVCNLISIVVLVHLHAGLVALVIASSASLVGANLLCLLWLWYFHKPWLLPRVAHLKAAAARRMMKTGSEFFMLQIAGLVVLNSDNLVVTHYLGPAQVAPYSVAWRLVGYSAVVQTLMVPSLWPAYSEAFARGDTAWVRRTFKRTMWVTMGVAVASSAFFAVAGRWIIGVWAGRAAVPSEELMLMMCVWVLLSTFMTNTATVLVAKGQTQLQAWCSLGAAVVNLVLSVYWVQRIGAFGVILGTIVSYLVVLVIPQTWQAFRVIRQPSASCGEDI
jgi:O-antigen/teichoic acid export membrane protein